MKLLKKVQFSFKLLPNGFKKKYIVFVLVQASFPILDVIGIGIIAVLIQLLENSNLVNQNNFSGDLLRALSSRFGFESQSLLISLAAIAGVLFILKGLFASIGNKKTYDLLTNGSLQFSSKIAKKFFSQSLSKIQLLPSNQVGMALNEAINHQVVSILASFSALIGEVTLILFIGTLLLIYSTTMTVVCSIYFLIVYMLLQKKLQRDSGRLATIKTSSDSKIRSLLQESISSFRELHVIDAIQDMLNDYDSERKINANTQARIFWLISLPKYVFESILVIGVLIMIAFDSISNKGGTNNYAIATFLIAGVRILPSILRIQAASNTIQVSFSYSFFLRDFLEVTNVDEGSNFREDFEDYPKRDSIKVFDSTLTIDKLKFSYEGNDSFELSIDSLRIGKGERVALVGTSGSGKSTFADLILGVIPPSQGDIRISGIRPHQAIQRYPGKIGYVPQQPNLLGADVFGNVAVYSESTEANRARVWQCLELAHLAEQMRSMPLGLETYLGESGYKLSGGQKQRLSLARALFPDPELLVLDEATSSLDAETEFDVKTTLEKLSSEVTIVVIAHRLSTIKSFSRLLYFEKGEIVADGTFEELRRRNENFDRQAYLSGF